MKKFADWITIREMGFGPYIGNCVDTNDYQVMGACSDQNSDKKNNSIKNGAVLHKKVKRKK